MKIYIDQGHNPQNPDCGIEANGFREQDITYEIGIQLDSILRASGIESLLSRPTKNAQLGFGKTNSASARVDEANNWGADYFISLHTGTSSDPFATGSSCIVYRINSSATALAESIAENLSLATKLQNRGVYSSSDYGILRKTKIPSLVVEMGFITNKNDALLMAENPFIFARGIANGIMNFANISDTSELSANISPTPFFQLYPEGCKRMCRLYVDVFTERTRNVSVPKADVTVLQGSQGKHIVIYRGYSDYSGHTIPIELPIYNEENFKTSPPQMYCICVRHPDYLPKNQWVEIKDEESVRQSVALVAK